VAALIYSAIASLDGYVADREGKWDWSVPDEEVHAFVNDQEREVGTYLYGRKMYDVMRAWQDDALLGDDPEPVMQDYASIWRAADKVVFSSTLAEATTPRTRIEPAFDAARVAALVRDAGSDVSIGGPTLAAAALRAGLVDEIRLLLSPVSVGGGLRALPEDVRLDLSLRDERRFANGVVAVSYAVSAPRSRPPAAR
jgi:dihydrofolate reductase